VRFVCVEGYFGRIAAGSHSQPAINFAVPATVELLYLKPKLNVRISSLDRPNYRAALQLEKLMEAEDRLLILSLCEACEQRTAAHNRPESWVGESKSFEIV